MKELESFCESTVVDMAVLTLPKDYVAEEARRLIEIGVEGLWNFTGKDLDYDPARVVVENVHLGDSLMILDYLICRKTEELADEAEQKK
jgi:redox-sensing transcriptional repressor